MPEDWAAVARTINERVRELGWQQRELAERSRVSQATVREIQHHTVERRRSSRTLESLSTALGMHPEHLATVLRGERPPATDEPPENREDTLSSRMTTLEIRIGATNERLDDLHSDVKALLREVRKWS